MKSTSKEKLFRMLLMLFPKYGLVKVQKGGSVILRQRKLSFKSVRLSLLELALYYIPNEISLSRWGNYDLVHSYADKVREILNNGNYDDETKKDIVISYLYSEFISTKIRNIYADLDEIVIPLEQGGYLKYSENQKPSIKEELSDYIEEVKIVKGSEYSYKIVTIAASILLPLFLNYRIIVTNLAQIDIFKLIHASSAVIAHQEYSWIIK
jgi:hypothetical protein